MSSLSSVLEALLYLHFDIVSGEIAAKPFPIDANSSETVERKIFADIGALAIDSHACIGAMTTTLMGRSKPAPP